MTDGYQPKGPPFDPDKVVPPPSGTGVQPPPRQDRQHFEALLKEVVDRYRGHAVPESPTPCLCACSECLHLIERIEYALGRRPHLPVSPGAKRCEIHSWEYYGERCEFCSLQCKDCRFLERDVQFEEWDCAHPERPQGKSAVNPRDDAPEWCPWRRPRLVRIKK